MLFIIYIIYLQLVVQYIGNSNITLLYYTAVPKISKNSYYAHLIFGIHNVAGGFAPHISQNTICISIFHNNLITAFT